MRRLFELSSGLEEHYFWKSEREVCFFRHVALTEDPDDPGRWELAGFNAESGAPIDLEAFNSRHTSRLIGAVGHTHFDGEPGHEVSYIPPVHVASYGAESEGRRDGALRLAWLRNHPQEQQEWTAACLDGSDAHHWPHPPDPVSGEPLSGHAIWLRDGHRVAVFRSRYQRGAYTLPEARIYDCDHPAAVLSISLSGATDDLLVGLVDHEQVLFRKWDGPSRPTAKVSFQRIRLDTPAAVATHFAVELPHRAETCDVVSSPAGERLAWVLGEQDGEDYSYGIWISTSDGQQFQRFATLPGISEDTGYHWPRELTWKPNGQHLGFLYHGALWEAEVA